MKVIRFDNELVGKTIAFAHVAQFAENITIATDDGCVMIITQEIDDEGDDKQTQILNENAALRYIENNDYVRSALGQLGIFDVAAYKKKKQEEIKKKQEELRVRQLKEERELYERLKAKYAKDVD